LRKRSTPEFLLLIRVAILVFVVRVGLWLAPFQTIRRIVAFLAKPAPKIAKCFSVEQLSRAISTAAAYVPKATCLTQALALHIMLRRRALQSRIRIGVAKDKSGIVEAHAWVESEEQVVIGDFNLDYYSPMMDWD
jgi:hypothetical protein